MTQKFVQRLAGTCLTSSPKACRCHSVHATSIYDHALRKPYKTTAAAGGIFRIILRLEIAYWNTTHNMQKHAGKRTLHCMIPAGWSK